MRRFHFRFITALTVLLSLCTLTLAQNKAFDTSRMDTSADACTDFFQYSNGSWVKNTEIPAAYSRWGTFNILADNNYAKLKDVLENAAPCSACVPRTKHITFPDEQDGRGSAGPGGFADCGRMRRLPWK